MRDMTRLFAIFIVASMAVWTVGDAVAQSNICLRLDRQLRSLDSNRDYRNYQQNVARARAGSEELKAMESEFVRRGYQRQLNSGQRLNRQGRALARSIQRARSDVARLVTRANRGAGVARTREDILQEIARFGCRTGSSVTQRTENFTVANTVSAPIGIATQRIENRRVASSGAARSPPAEHLPEGRAGIKAGGSIAGRAAIHSTLTRSKGT